MARRTGGSATAYISPSILKYEVSKGSKFVLEFLDIKENHLIFISSSCILTFSILPLLNFRNKEN
jgi:hypothetical protein